MNKIKPIRSFVRRQRRLPSSKQKIFDEGWVLYGLDIASGAISTPLVLEIGFGMGTTLFNSAKKYPDKNFIGIEVHQPGIVALLAQLKAQPLNNIRLYNEDAVIVLEQSIPDNSLEKVLIFFPDPWQKNRHHKRRLIQPKFIALLQKKLKPKGVLHIATDWEDYANHIIAVLKANSAFTACEPLESLPFLADRIPTKFEQRGKKQGHKIFDLLFIANC
ncbi:MAG: tRNA (guanosine(46)-N7)-methyltransferase TrmB [bacterium]